MTQHPYLAITDDDREQMLATIGVPSVEELFRDIPAGVRFQALSSRFGWAGFGFSRSAMIPTR